MRLIFLGDPIAPNQRPLIVILVLGYSFRQHSFSPLALFCPEYAFRISDMQLRRARRSLVRGHDMPGGVSCVRLFSITSRAREYSYPAPVENARSIGLSFHCRSGSLMRAEQAFLLLHPHFEPELD